MPVAQWQWDWLAAQMVQQEVVESRSEFQDHEGWCQLLEASSSSWKAPWWALWRLQLDPLPGAQDLDLDLGGHLHLLPEAQDLE